MTQRSFEQDVAGSEQGVLSQIHNGMEVSDRNGNYVGRVKFIHLGERNAPGMSSSTPLYSDEPLVEALAGAFGKDDLPEVARSRLMHDGFIRIDSGRLFGATRYALRDQIAGVYGDIIHLNVTRGELIRK